MAIRNQNKNTVVPIQESGYSTLYEHPGHGSGRFNFDVEPWENEMGALMYRFEGKQGGTWDLPLENEYQGNRWEDTHHAEGDWDRYSQMSRQNQRGTMQAMWGDSEVAKTLYGLLQRGEPFQQVGAALKPFDTWRSISAGEPEANDRAIREKNTKILLGNK